jgi:hypothetical protein
MTEQAERRYTWYEVLSGAIPEGTHVAHYMGTDRTSTDTGPGRVSYGVHTGTLGFTQDGVGRHATLNGRKVLPYHGDDYWIITEEKMNEVEPFPRESPA